jgi:hypothetical protein
MLGLDRAGPLAGVMELRTALPGDRIGDGPGSRRLDHREVPSAGGIETVAARSVGPDCEVLATVASVGGERVYAVLREKPRGGSGRLGWVRGSFSCTFGGGHLPIPDDPRKLFRSEVLLRWVLDRFGYRFQFEKPSVQTPTPLVLGARSKNGLFLSGYCPSTVAKIRLRFPHGAPLLLGQETWLQNGESTYQMPRAWHHEVRCLVDQKQDGEIACVERHSENLHVRRRIWVRGLKDATVHFYPERPERQSRVVMAANDMRFHNEDSLTYSVEEGGRRLVARRITGELLISW